MNRRELLNDLMRFKWAKLSYRGETYYAFPACESLGWDGGDVDGFGWLLLCAAGVKDGWCWWEIKGCGNNLSRPQRSFLAEIPAWKEVRGKGWAVWIEPDELDDFFDLEDLHFSVKNLFLSPINQ